MACSCCGCLPPRRGMWLATWKRSVSQQMLHIPQIVENVHGQEWGGCLRRLQIYLPGSSKENLEQAPPYNPNDAIPPTLVFGEYSKCKSEQGKEGLHRQFHRNTSECDVARESPRGQKPLFRRRILNVHTTQILASYFCTCVDVLSISTFLRMVGHVKNHAAVCTCAGTGGRCSV